MDELPKKMLWIYIVYACAAHKRLKFIDVGGEEVLAKSQEVSSMKRKRIEIGVEEGWERCYDNTNLSQKEEYGEILVSRLLLLLLLLPCF